MAGVTVKPLYVAIILAWVLVAGAIVYFSGAGAISLPTKIVGEVRRRVLQDASGRVGPPEGHCYLPIGKLKEAPLAMARVNCADDQQAYYNTARNSFWGSDGFNRFMDTVFSKAGNNAFFQGQTETGRPQDEDYHGRPITIVHIGAHLGNIFDRYSALRRGTNLEDRIIMIEPNPANFERLARRSRLDPRFVLVHAAIDKEKGALQPPTDEASASAAITTAAGKEGVWVNYKDPSTVPMGGGSGHEVRINSGRKWFAYSGTPNTLGNGGHIVDEPPVEVAGNASARTEAGFHVHVVTLDDVLMPYIKGETHPFVDESRQQHSLVQLNDPIEPFTRAADIRMREKRRLAKAGAAGGGEDTAAALAAGTEGWIDVIVMDVEGWEPRVLMGAQAALAHAKMVVFGCSQRWVAHSKLTTNKRTFQLLQDSGFTVFLLGKERNVITNDGLGPDKVYDRLNAWGFCAAVRTTLLTSTADGGAAGDAAQAAGSGSSGARGLGIPSGPVPGQHYLPYVGNLTALAQLITGYPSYSPLRGVDSPVCLRYVAGQMWHACKEAGRGYHSREEHEAVHGHGHTRA